MKADILVDCIIKPTLEKASVVFGDPSQNIIQLLLLTAKQESNCGANLKQINGPACGIFQMEPATLKDHEDWMCKHKPIFWKMHSNFYPADLIQNNAYACFMARMHYWRKPEPLPQAGDIEGLAKYWKTHYNTANGHGTVEQCMVNADSLPQKLLVV